MKFGYWIPAISLAVAIYVSSSLERPVQPDLGVDFGDKILHFMAYGFLSLFFLLGLNTGRNPEVKRWQLLLAIVVASLYGATDEYHQSFVTNRDSNFFDWVADTVGAIAGALVYIYISKIKQTE